MNNQEKVWKVGMYVGILLAIFLAVLSIKGFKEIGYVGANVALTNQISVDGKGDAVTIPDVATLSFSVIETAKTVSQAQSKATDKSNSALKAVRAAGIAERDIQTTSYNINPHYEYQTAVCSAGYCPPSKSVLTGYEVSQTTQIKIRDFSKIGDILTSIASLEVQNVSGISFSVDKPEKLQAEARAAAIKDAQSKADTLASQLGVRLVRIISFNESSGGNYPRPMLYGMGGDAMSTKAATPEISAGEQKITSNVTITYQID